MHVEDDQKKFRGVKRTRSGSWGAWIREPPLLQDATCLNRSGRRRWIGRFPDAESAALAYDAVARELYGPAAITNFAVK